MRFKLMLAIILHVQDYNDDGSARDNKPSKVYNCKHYNYRLSRKRSSIIYLTQRERWQWRKGRWHWREERQHWRKERPP